jgi:hypothetical protein
MRLKQHSRLFAVILFLVLGVSYLWCIVDNILSSAEMANAGGEIEVTAVVMFSAIVWLIGHGIHGVIFLALPVLMWPRKEVEEQTLAY